LNDWLDTLKVNKWLHRCVAITVRLDEVRHT